MTGMLATLATYITGPLVFVAAWYIHQKIRMTRFACILAAIGGLVTYNSLVGDWLSGIAKAVGITAGIAVIVLICIIIADVKGKKKGADKPALISSFLLPIFVVAGLAAVPVLLDQAGGGLQKVTTNVNVGR